MNRVRFFLYSLILLSAAILASSDAADWPLKDARAIHLYYHGPESVAFYNEITPQSSTDGTFFMVSGFTGGYLGLQQLSSGEKNVIFSVWDPGRQDDSNGVPQEKRVKVLMQGKDVSVGRFGGEGTGAQSFFRYTWQVGETYRFFLKSEKKGGATAYSAFLFIQEVGRWKQLATLQTLADGKNLVGLYSFIEDFKRDGESYKQLRKASYSNGWSMSETGKWSGLSTATFAAYSPHPLQNINAGSSGHSFFLVTGAETVNTLSVGSILTVTGAAQKPSNLPIQHSKDHDFGFRPRETILHEYATPHGSLVYIEETKLWEERAKTGERFVFREIQNSGSFILIRDGARNVYLRLPRSGGTVRFSYDNVKWQNLYEVRKIR